jgi:hypothetical protein
MFAVIVLRIIALRWGETNDFSTLARCRKNITRLKGANGQRAANPSSPGKSRRCGTKSGQEQ